MATALKRSISLLLVLVLAFGVIPIAFAAETEATDSTDPTESTTIPTEETLPVETTESTEPPETTAATEETTAPTETTEPPVMFMTNSGIATIAEAEINGAPNAFAYSDMLLPGQYFIREIHDRDDTYWEYDAVVEKEVTVTAGSQVEVTYTNTQYGKIQIQKSMPDGGSLDGWQFSITDTSGKEIDGAPFTTNASGLILTGKLQPGEYTVKEIIPEGSFYYCTSDNPQTITVKAGETAQVSFTNAMRYGQITIEKVDSRGEPLAGAKFLLEWSEDGSLWWPIEYSETLGEGKCSNPNIEDGCLTSGKDGLLEWPDLHPGLYYRMTELEAPKGYTLLSKPAFEGKLPSEELTVSLRVVNCEIFTLPQTGSTTAAIFRISQLLCICVCSILLIHSYRKERK